MLLKTSLGSAYIHNIDLIDESKEVILFVPGAGMDHRVANLFDLNPKMFNRVVSLLNIFGFRSNKFATL